MPHQQYPWEGERFHPTTASSHRRQAAEDPGDKGAKIPSVLYTHHRLSRELMWDGARQAQVSHCTSSPQQHKRPWCFLWKLLYCCHSIASCPSPRGSAQEEALMITGFCTELLTFFPPKLSVSHSGSVLSRCPLWRPHLYPVYPTATSGPFHVPYLCPHLWGQSLTPALRSLSLRVLFPSGIPAHTGG